MKITLVIPAYNEQAYLSACLEAALAEKTRSKHEVEIIVVNNASTDSTKEVALSFPGVSVVDEPRKGLSFARQAGFLRASGELLAHIDADSVITPGWIDGVADEFLQNPKLIALSGPVIYYDLPLMTNIIIRFYYYLGFLSYIINRFIFRVSSLAQGSNLVARTSALRAIGGYNTKLAFYGEDTELARRLHPLGPVEFSFKFPVYTSGRRLKAEGVFKMGLKYQINYFWTIFFKRPFHQTYNDVRLEEPKQAAKTTDIKKLNHSLFLAKSFLLLGCLLFFFTTRLPFGESLVAKAEASGKKHDHLHIRGAWHALGNDTTHSVKGMLKDADHDGN